MRPSRDADEPVAIRASITTATRTILNRCVQQFVARHNVHGLETLDRISAAVLAMAGTRLRYREPVD